MGYADVKTTLRYVDISEADKRNEIDSVFGVAATWQRERDRPRDFLLSP